MHGEKGNWQIEYSFEWDDEKSRVNIEKHGISFESARFVFADENHVILYDDIHSVNEERYIAIGMVDKILYVVHTIRNERIRIISARSATEAERRIYYDGLF
ncbi:MAG: BrnT family toxin [Lachnospiraceae bacterium]|nr:BrnT family toxin [Lachnospiraceae bacterium]